MSAKIITEKRVLYSQVSNCNAQVIKGDIYILMEYRQVVVVSRLFISLAYNYLSNKACFKI